MRWTFTQAKDRVPVRVVREGRPDLTGRLLSIPGGDRWRGGQRCRVQLPSGAVISVCVDQLQEAK